MCIYAMWTKPFLCICQRQIKVTHKFVSCARAQPLQTLCLVRVAASSRCLSAMACALPAKHPSLLLNGKTKTDQCNAAVKGARNAREARLEDSARWQERRRGTKQIDRQGYAHFAKSHLQFVFDSMCGGAGGTCFFPGSGRASPLSEGGCKPWGLQRLAWKNPKPRG